MIPWGHYAWSDDVREPGRYLYYTVSPRCWDPEHEIHPLHVFFGPDGNFWCRKSIDHLPVPLSVFRATRRRYLGPWLS